MVSTPVQCGLMQQYAPPGRTAQGEPLAGTPLVRGGAHERVCRIGCPVKILTRVPYTDTSAEGLATLGPCPAPALPEAVRRYW